MSELQRWLTDFGLGGVTGQLLDLGYDSLQQIRGLKGSELDNLMSKLRTQQQDMDDFELTKSMQNATRTPHAESGHRHSYRYDSGGDCSFAQSIPPLSAAVRPLEPDMAY